jgi:hypothetical protein
MILRWIYCLLCIRELDQSWSYCKCIARSGQYGIRSFQPLAAALPIATSFGFAPILHRVVLCVLTYGYGSHTACLITSCTYLRDRSLRYIFLLLNWCTHQSFDRQAHWRTTQPFSQAAHWSRHQPFGRQRHGTGRHR